MNTVNTASPVWWQPALGHEGRVTGADDIAQSIRIILATPKGADPHRPEFGNQLYLYLDWPVDRARPYVIREAVDAIRQWEKRCQVIRVELVTDGEHMTLRVRWRVDSGAETSTEVVWR
ncbi:baseplate protein [Salmonella enterica subsp. enterica]|nr:baseplate protein [Salmonella enterica subsp. enterica serovar Mikawasima]